MLVLGIDPGSRCMGLGLVKENGAKLDLILAKAVYPNSTYSLEQKLGYLFEQVGLVIERYQPQEAALEDVFFALNARSALKLGQARGAVIVACVSKNIPIYSYTPTQVKQSLVGAGRASKDQVQFMVKQLLQSKDSWPLDVSDALAVAITHLNSRKLNRLVAKT